MFSLFSESTIKGWQLMSFCLATFPPSKHLKSFLLDVLKKGSEESDPRIASLAQLCTQRLPHILALGQRKQVPSAVELQCLTDGKPIPIRVNLAGGQFLTFTVDPYTLVKQVEDMLTGKLNLTLKTPFGLFEAAEANVERLLDARERVLDVVAGWENKPLVEEIKVDPKKVKDKDGKLVAKTAIKEVRYTSLLYKAKLVLKTSNPDLMADPEAVNLLYLQATQDVVTERYPCNEKDITVLAALQLQASFGDYKVSWQIHQLLSSMSC